VSFSVTRWPMGEQRPTPAVEEFAMVGWLELGCVCRGWL